LWLLLPTLMYGQINGYTPPAKTGNVVLDDENHTKSKTDWIKNNPEAYRTAGGNPNEVLQNANPNPTKNATKIELPIFNAEKTYALINVKAVAAASHQVSDAELAKETELAKEKMNVGTSKLSFDAQNNLRWWISERVDRIGQELKKSNLEVEWIFKTQQCENCQKIYYLKTLTSSANTITYQMKNEDGNSKFDYQFIYQLIP
jgi:hypothetical protein